MIKENLKNTSWIGSYFIYFIYLITVHYHINYSGLSRYTSQHRVLWLVNTTLEFYLIALLNIPLTLCSENWVFSPILPISALSSKNLPCFCLGHWAGKKLFQLERNPTLTSSWTSTSSYFNDLMVSLNTDWKYYVGHVIVIMLT